MPLSSRKNGTKSRTGHRKATKDVSNENATKIIIPKATSMPRPLKPKSKALQNTSNHVDETEGAAMVLMSLQNHQPFEADITSSNDDIYGSEEDGMDGSGVDEEIDELEEDSDAECEFIFSTFFPVFLILILR
jgi:hypothetical protein